MLSVQTAPLEVTNRVNQNRSFGLTSMRAWFSCTESRASRILIKVNDETAEFNAEDCVVHFKGDEWFILFNIVTHLFPDGMLQVSLTVEFLNGEKHEFPNRFLAIANNSNLAKKVTNDLKAYGTPPIIPRYVDSTHFPYETGGARAWFDHEEVQPIPLDFEPAADMETAHRHLERWGFCVLPDLLPQEIIQDFKDVINESIKTKRLIHAEGSSERIFDAHRLEAGRKIWLYPPVMRFLNEHFRDEPCACQTLTYVNGSEQNPHQDTIHLTPYPAGFMAGVWVALEDVQPDSGELFVYPGSHKTPRLRATHLGLDKVDQDYSSYKKFDDEIQRMMADGGFDRRTYLAKAGQILVWHENLVHGGSVRHDRSKTRFSIVSHYFAKGAIAYYDSRGEAAALEELPQAI